MSEKLSLSRKAFLGLPLAGAGLIVVMSTQWGRALPWPPCPLYALTGLYCPGCGSTRCLMALSEGDFLLALRQNPFVIVALGYLTLAWSMLVGRLWVQKHKNSGRIAAFLSRPEKGHPYIILGVFVVIAAFGVLRNFLPILAPLP